MFEFDADRSYDRDEFLSFLENLGFDRPQVEREIDKGKARPRSHFTILALDDEWLALEMWRPRQARAKRAYRVMTVRSAARVPAEYYVLSEFEKDTAWPSSGASSNVDPYPESSHGPGFNP